MVDWIYSEDDAPYGGFGVRVIRDSMTPKQRKAHDEAWSMSFDDSGDATLVSWGNADDEHPGSVAMAGGFEEFLADNPEMTTFIDERGWSLLHGHASAGSTSVVAKLLEHGADATLATKAGDTAADLARKGPWPEVVALLEG